MDTTTTFTCTICGEGSTAICTFCTKDTCGNHLCDRCLRCSDCCECEVPRGEPQTNGHQYLADEPELVSQ